MGGKKRTHFCTLFVCKDLLHTQRLCGVVARDWEPWVASGAVSGLSLWVQILCYTFCPHRHYSQLVGTTYNRKNQATQRIQLYSAVVKLKDSDGGEQGSSLVLCYRKGEPGCGGWSTPPEVTFWCGQSRDEGHLVVKVTASLSFFWVVLISL